MHVCIYVTVCYICFLWVLCMQADFWTHLQIQSGFHPLLLRWFRSLGSLWVICFSWLGCISVLKLCWLTAVRVWMYSLQHWQTTGLMRSRFENFLRFRMWYWHSSWLHRAPTQPSGWCVLPVLTHNTNGGLVPEDVQHESEHVSVYLLQSSHIHIYILMNGRKMIVIPLHRLSTPNF